MVYESENGNSTDEAQSKGKEGACLDAEKLAKEIQGVRDHRAARHRSRSAQPSGACPCSPPPPTYPETYYRKYQPFMWNTIMECERISYQVAEYIGKRLLDKPAKLAGDPVLQKKTRYFATYVPDNDGYQSCVKITQNELQVEVRRQGHRAAVQLPARHHPVP